MILLKLSEKMELFSTESLNRFKLKKFYFKIKFFPNDINLDIF